jgi:heme exporter protein C
MIRWIVFLGMIAGTIGAFAVGPAVNFQSPDLFRVIFFHLPCAFASSLYFFVGAYYGLRTLLASGSAQLTMDVKAVSTNEMAMIMAALTMVTGILFSKVQWGDWWSWDPRQTSFLFVLLIYAAYFALRASFADEAMRAKISGAYSAFSLLPTLFLIFVFPRLPAVEKLSLHPSDTVTGGKFSPEYWLVILPIFALLMITSAYLVSLANRAGVLELQVRHGNLEADRNGAAPTGVVRPVSLPAPSGGEDSTS